MHVCDGLGFFFLAFSLSFTNNRIHLIYVAFLSEQEQLDGAGVELSSLYKWIERQVPIACCTEAWKTRTHWVGTQISLDATKSVAQAEEYLKIHRPVRRFMLYILI